MPVNAFLYFNGISLLFKSTNTVNATYRHAYSLWPGIVHANGLRIVFQDKNLQFSLDIGHLKARIVLSELIKRRFHVKWVSGGGAAFRMRHRIQPESRDESWVAALPPIPEFPAPAVFEPTVPEPPIPDSEYSLWTVHLEDVDVGVDEVWVQFVRYSGAGRAKGAFRLVPARTLWVGPASLAIEGGRIHFGQQTISSHLTGRVDCKVDYFDVRIPQGREVFRYINTDVSLNARQFVIDPFLQFFSTPSTHISSKPAALSANVHVTQGRLIPGSSLSYSGTNVLLTTPDLPFEASGVRVSGEMSDTNTATIAFGVDTGIVGRQSAIVAEQVTGSLVAKGSDLTADFELTDKTLRARHVVVPDARRLNEVFAGKLPAIFERGSLQASVVASELGEQRQLDVQIPQAAVWLRHSNSRVQLAGALGFSAHGQRSGSALKATAWAKLDNARLSGGATPSQESAAEMRSIRADGSYVVSAYNRELKFSTTIEAITGTTGSSRQTSIVGRKLTARGKLNGVQRRINGEAEFGFDSLQVRSKKSVLSIRPTAQLVLSDFDSEHLTGKVKLGLGLAGWNATYGDDSGQCSSLAIPNAHFGALAILGKSRVDATIQAALQGLQLTWGADFRMSSNLTLRSRLSASTDRAWSEVALSARLLHASIVSGKGGTSGWAATLPDVQLESRISRAEQILGSLTMGAKDATARIGGVHIATGIQMALPRIRIDVTSHSAVVDGQVRITNAGMHSDNHHVSGWWATIDARSAQLLARENLDFATHFQASLRDATPGIILLAEDGKLPDWFADALPLREMRIQGHAARRCRLTTIRVDQATGGPLSARGTLQSTSDLVRGAFLVRLAAVEMLSAGVEVGPPDSGVSLLAGEQWLRKRTDRLDHAATQILASPCRSEPQNCGDELAARQ